jgi:hypothetical protein
MPNDIGQEPSFGPDEDENLGEDETYARLVKKQDSGMELTQEERQFMMDYENGRQGADRIVGGTMSAGSMPMGPSMGRGALHL